jgi:arabinofuranosyltransferase
MNVHTQQSSARATFFVRCTLLVLSACVLAFAVRTRDCFLDDAYIGFQYVSNLLAGHGFVFHAGDAPVEGVTNIGWLLSLAPLAWLTELPIAAKLAGLALVLFTLILTVHLGNRLSACSTEPDDSLALALLSALLIAVSFDFLYFSLAGMETGLLATLLMLMACVALDRPCSTLLPILGAAVFLVHPEAAAVYPLYAAFSLSRSDSLSPVGRRSIFVGGAIFVVLIVAITAARFAYFGDLVPNTFHAKPSGLRSAVDSGYAFLRGQNTNVAFPITGWLALPVLMLGYLRIRREYLATHAADMLAASCAIGLAFAFYSPADWTGMARYFAPYLPVALILFSAGLGEVLRLAIGTTARPGTRQAVAALVAAVLVLTSLANSQANVARLDEFPGYVMAGRNLVGPATWMRDHLPPGATVATRRIGALAYFSDRPVFDYTYGLADRDVARLVAAHGGHFDTPADPALNELWRTRAPEYLLEDSPILDAIIAEAGGTRDHFSIHGVVYRVLTQFSIGRGSQWVLAQRVAPRGQNPLPPAKVPMSAVSRNTPFGPP